MDRDIQDNTKKLCEACGDGNIEVVEEMLSNKVVLINGVYGGDTPLMWAIEHGHLDIVRRLLEVPDIKLDCIGETVLHRACDLNNVSILKLLCQDSRCSPG